MSSGIRASGMVSGLDTESLVQAMVSTQVSKKEKLQKAQTKLQWKQDAFKSLNTKVYGLYSKVGNLRFSSAYNMKKTTVSDTTKAQVTASNTAVNGIQTLQIKQLATSGYLTGGELKKVPPVRPRSRSLAMTVQIPAYQSPSVHQRRILM